MATEHSATSVITDHKAKASGAFKAFVDRVDYDLVSTLRADPDATADGLDHRPRQVFSGHYVPVAPAPIPDSVYISHSPAFFAELGLSDDLALNEEFRAIFSGDLSKVPASMKQVGWATGYALSIYGTEYTQQCPFGTGNGYGDGRAISILELVSNGKHWEMQLKGGGPTPYCRGADGRAVLRSSVREFCAQEYMHALGVPTSRSLTLYASTSETVMRPWYSDGSKSLDPDIMVENPVAISTRVARSFLRVGQIELFARRVRNQAHPEAMEELRQIVAHAIDREYHDEIDQDLPFAEQVAALAQEFRHRLITMVGHWMRVGYCQGNFNSDNCAVGGFTLDYGPFGFCEVFDRNFQPWTGGGRHFSFFNQPVAAEANFHMLWSALSALVPVGTPERERFTQIREDFPAEMRLQVEKVWAAKLGLAELDADVLQRLFDLMEQYGADFTMLFRELSDVPQQAEALLKAFSETISPKLQESWQSWLESWLAVLHDQHGDDLSALPQRMKQVNPKYAWREWHIAPAYQQAARGDYASVRELQQIFSDPYAEQGPEIDADFYQIRPKEVASLGGICHYSCSS